MWWRWIFSSVAPRGDVLLLLEGWGRVQCGSRRRESLACQRGEGRDGQTLGRRAKGACARTLSERRGRAREEPAEPARDVMTVGLASTGTRPGAALPDTRASRRAPGGPRRDARAGGSHAPWPHAALACRFARTVPPHPAAPDAPRRGTAAAAAAAAAAALRVERERRTNLGGGRSSPAHRSATKRRTKHGHGTRTAHKRTQTQALMQGVLQAGSQGK